jgi:hypothetical protein
MKGKMNFDLVIWLVAIIILGSFMIIECADAGDKTVTTIIIKKQRRSESGVTSKTYTHHFETNRRGDIERVDRVKTTYRGGRSKTRVTRSGWSERGGTVRYHEKTKVHRTRSKKGDY